jgi:hypothetical protein
MVIAPTNRAAPHPFLTAAAVLAWWPGHHDARHPQRAGPR